jgi:hypothetical protein
MAYKRRRRESKIIKRVKRMLAPLKPEVKFHFDAQLAVSTSTLFNNVPLQSFMPQANAAIGGAFVGNEIRAKYLKIRGSVYNGSAVDTYQIRLIVVMDHEPMDGNLILNSAAATNGFEILVAPDIDSFVHPRIHRRCTVLWDKLWSIGPKGTTQNERTYSKKFNLGSKKLIYEVSALGGLYPVNSQIKMYWVADTAEMYYWYHAIFAYTDG